MRSKTQDNIRGLSSNNELICLSESWLKRGSDSKTVPIAKRKERRLTKTDSVRNCTIKLFLRLPNTFLMPTSLARLDECAVERFIKLTHAISRIKIAIAEKIYTYWELLFVPNSSLIFECKCICVSGVRLI